MAGKISALLLFVSINVFCSASPAYGIDLGVGFMAPNGGGSILGDPVIVPNAVLSFGPLALGLDLWASPSNEIFFLLPFIEFQFQLAVASIYAGVGPTLIGSSEGIDLEPPPLDFNAKLGASGALLIFSVYGEVVLNGVPAFGKLSSLSFVAGARFSL